MVVESRVMPPRRPFDRLLLGLGAFHGFLAVALGAFGAHGLRRLLDASDAEQRLAWWETAARYQLAHAIVLVVLAVAGLGVPGRRAGIAMAFGALVFAGSLDVMTLTGVRALGAITPIGGVGLLVGWALLGMTALSKTDA